MICQNAHHDILQSFAFTRLSDHDTLQSHGFSLADPPPLQPRNRGFFLLVTQRRNWVSFSQRHTLVFLEFFVHLVDALKLFLIILFDNVMLVVGAFALFTGDFHVKPQLVGLETQLYLHPIFALIRVAKAFHL